MRWLLVLAACGPPRPAEGPAFPAVADPAPPAIPASDGCIDRESGNVENSPVYQAIDRYREAWFAQATARRGWRALPAPDLPQQIGSSTRPGFDLMFGEVHARQLTPDLLLDEHGQLWLRTRLRFRCSLDTPRFFIDSDLAVFEVEYQPICRETRVVNLCGSYLAGGCGIDPGPQHEDSIAEWWFAPVPRGAHWLGTEPIRITSDVAVCFEAKPALVTTPP